jgi:N-methylhydantoinase A
VTSSAQGTVVAIDSGGTFTDCVVLDADGRVTIGKAPSTPRDFSLGVIEAVTRAAETLGVGLEELLASTYLFGLGTTAATNALLTRSGSRVGLITTKGHEDALIIGRTIQKAAGLNTAELTNLAKLEKADPIVPRHLIKGVSERTDYKGAVIVELNLEEARRALAELVDEGVEAIAISFLWSFMNPAHETAVAEMIASEHPGLMVSASHTVAPVIKEYERGATTMLNAYLSGTTDRSISALEDRLVQGGLEQAPLVMQSSGGFTSTAKAKGHAIRLVASGPAGGVIGAAAVGQALGFANVITTDVGGTSFDVGLVVDGEPLVNPRPVFGKYHTVLPVTDVASIGAGGGSIAWIEQATGQLKVGPQSAGADPGPACYGNGGEQPTVTDANVALGRVDPESFLGGARPLHAELALRAIEEKIAVPLGLSVPEAAMGIVDILDARMADLVRRETIGRGYDPRDFALVAFGGAGPLHVCAYGRDVGARAIVVPSNASVFSAFGIAGADVVTIAQASDPMIAPFDLQRLNAHYSELEAAALADLEADGVAAGDATLVREIEMRYRGQVHEIRVPVPSGLLESEQHEQLMAEFEARYTRRYGRGTVHGQAGIEARTYAVRGIGRLATPPLAFEALGDSDPAQAHTAERSVFFRETAGFTPTSVYRWERLKPGHVVSGPAVIEAVTTSALVPPGYTARVDGMTNLMLEAG